MMGNFGKTAIVTFAGMTASFLAQLVIDKLDASKKRKELLKQTEADGSRLK